MTTTLRSLVETSGLGPAAQLVGDGDVTVTDVTLDSRAVRPGSLFCAVRGRLLDAHDLVPAAVAAGAAAVCVERLPVVPVPAVVPVVVVPDVRAAVPHLAAAFHGHPSRRLRVVGVTGTNGKTTVTSLVAAVLRHAGTPTEVLGTLSGRFTTPEAPELQERLAGWERAGVRAVAMEVSSHALALHRADATAFAAAVFTNLSPEHLDFHGTMEAYFAAKARLFEAGRAAYAVVNADDPYGRRLLDGAAVPTEGFSLAHAEQLHLGAVTTFRWRGVPVRLPLRGRFNVMNALAALATSVHLGVPAPVAADALAAAPQVPGRMEAVPVPPHTGFSVFVDYAHTPDGLEVVLRTAKELADGGRVVVVFGCGGDRDRAKRPLMGAVAARWADVTVLTSDNPRSEEPAAIIAEVRAGMTGARGTVAEEPDRRRAIAVALEAAGRGDVVVVAGKGHETTQTIGDQVRPFSDVAEVQHLLGGAPA